MGDLKDLTKETLPKMIFTFITATVTNLMAKESIKSAVRGRIRKLITGNAEKPYKDIHTVEMYADNIMDILDKNRILPQNIGIDGPPGSGKSSLGRSLAKRTGLEWKTLYLNDLGKPYFFKQGRIYENIRLFRTQNIDNFDVIIYIDCPVEDAQSRVMKRDRNGALVDYINFIKLKEIGDASFEMANGEEFRIPMSPIRIKIRPEEGYKDIENLKMKLISKGLDIERFSKEELLFLHCYGKPKSGILPYVNWGAYNSELLSAAQVSLRLATAKKLLS
ncbi:MAG: (d)CMP kinase [Desulfobacterales bacterium]|nr:(d)CMP kinase [Desulfobacterales bacterium]